METQKRKQNQRQLRQRQKVKRSKYLTIRTHRIPVDIDGYIKNESDWNNTVAQIIADNENIILCDAHWEILHLLREFYKAYQHVPSMRPLIKYIVTNLNKEKGSSLYLMSLFTESPVKIAAKIAGLPKPTNCI